MNNKISDLDELVLSVRDNESRRLISEAVNAYRGGACRSAIISTWIAVSFDIISKIRELEARGEPAAKMFVEKLTNAISSKNVKQLQEIENGLLDLARNDFAFLLSHEAVDLDRLFADRDLCAHPAFVSDDALFTPSPELVRAHIAHSVHHLLAHPPVQGKSALLRLHRAILGLGFPSDPAKVLTVMRDDYLHLTKDSVVVSIAKGLLLTPLRGERAKFVGRERSLAQAFVAVGQIRPDLFEANMPGFIKTTAEQTGEPEFLQFLRFAAAEPRCWTWIGEPARIRMLELLTHAPLDGLIAAGCFDTLSIEEIAAVLIPRVSGLETEQRYNVIAENPRPQFCSEAIKLYGESGSFRTAELRGAKLILAHAKFFTPVEFDLVLRAAIENKYSQILSAAGTSDILIALFEIRSELARSCAARWTALLDTLVAKKLIGDYKYPQLVEILRAGGIAASPTPAVALPATDVPF